MKTKKIYAILGIILVIILVFLFIKKPLHAPTEELNLTENVDTSTPEEQVPPVTNSTTSTPTNPTYSYKNEEFGFAMNLPGYTATQKDRTKDKDTLFHPMVFTFGKTGSNEPNRMAVYIWNNPSEFDLIVLGGTNEGKVTVNGKVFDKYKIVDGDKTIYRYGIKVGSVVYDVGVNDTNDISRFYLLK